MSKELATVNFTDTIRDKVRTVMFETIPDDVIDTMMKKEFDSYFMDKIAQNHWDKSEESDFKKLIRAEIKTQMDERIRKIITDKLKTVTQSWDQDGSKLVGSLIEEMVPYAQAGYMKEVTRHTIQNLKQQLGAY